MSLDWWSIEVHDGEFSAEQWRRSHGEALVEAAVTNVARDWAWHVLPWGVVLELAFDAEGGWEQFRRLPAVRAALDAVPDPVNGLVVYPGRGGGSSARVPRRPKPPLGAGAAPLPVEPEPPLRAGLSAAEPPVTEGTLTARVYGYRAV